MDTPRLGQSPVGSLVPISGYDPRAQRDYNTFAFLPDPPPNEVELSPRTYMAIAEAASMVGRADQSIAQLPSPELLTRLAIRKEAVSTSAIEGTYAAMEDVLQADFVGAADMSAEVAEVHNYVIAAETATEWIEAQGPISISLMEHLQGILVRGTSSETTQAGHVRTTNVFIGLRGAQVEDARFVPCPHGHHLRDGLLAWEGWISRSTEDMHLLARMAIGHYQFETLHPFNDGNGRLGRLVLLLQLMASGELSYPIVALSPWLEARRQEYQEHLFEVSATGNFEPWIHFFCQAVTAQAKSAVERITTLVAIKEQMRATLHRQGAKGASLRIADDLIGYPMLTVKAMADRYDISYQAANLAVNKLVGLGLLRQFNEGRYDRIFVCDEAMNVLVR